MGGKYKEWWLTRLKNRNSWIDAVAHQVKQLQASLASHGTNLSPSWFTSNPFLCQCACESSSGWLKLLGLRGRPWKSSWPRSVVVALRMNQKMENFCLFLSFFNSAFQINKTELKKKKKGHMGSLPRWIRSCSSLNSFRFLSPFISQTFTAGWVFTIQTQLVLVFRVLAS